MQCNCCAVVAVVARLAYLQPAGVAAVASNLQSATQSLLNNGKMNLLENDCQTEAAQASSSNSRSGHSLVDVHTYVQCLPSSSCHIYFWSSHTKCLASWDYFFAAALPSYSASCCTLPLPLPQGGMQLVSIIKRQRIKLNAYICFGMRSNCRAMSAMRLAMYVCAWPKRPERMLSYSPNELRISTRSWYLDA